MGHVQAKPTIETKTIKCPFCNIGDVDIQITSEYMSVHGSHAAGRRSIIPNYHPEKIDVHNNCPSCGKSKQDIKQALETGSTKQLSHEDRLKRLRESGLPTRIEG